MSTHEYRLEHFRTRILHGVEFDNKKGIKFVQLVTKTRTGVSRMKVAVEDMNIKDYPHDGSVADKLVWNVENGRIELPAVIYITGWVVCQAISIKGSAIIMTTIDLEHVEEESRTEISSTSRATVIERMSTSSKRRATTIELDPTDESDEGEDIEPLQDRRKRRQVLASVDINVTPETPRPYSSKNRGPSQALPTIDENQQDKIGQDKAGEVSASQEKGATEKAGVDKVTSKQSGKARPARSSRSKEQDVVELGESA